MYIGRVLSQRALLTPERTALIYRGRHFSYQDLNGRVNRLTHFLSRMGIHRGDRVSALLPNCNEFVEIYFACSRIGAIFVPLNIRLSAPELDYMITDSRSVIFFYAARYEDQVARMEYPRGIVKVVIGGGDEDYESRLAQSSDQAQDVALDDGTINVIMYTSGTTGFPKGATLTHGNMYAAGLGMTISLPCRYPESCLILAPFFHSGAITPLLALIIRGVSAVVMEKFEPEAALELMAREKVTYMLGVATIMKMLLAVENLERFDLSALKTVFLPGSPLSTSLIQEAYNRIGVLCQNLWGMTEMCGPGSIVPEDYILTKGESAGKPYFNVDLRLVDSMGNDVPQGEMGEIIIRGPNMMLGYWNQPDATAATIRNGWLYSGDLAYLDEAGFLHVVDRIKDMILSGGENIYPAEVEKVILELPGINDAAVVGRPDEKWGESVVAFVQTSQYGGPDEAAIIDHCRQHLAGYKVPKQIHFLSELPKTPSGKILKKDLRRMAQSE